MPDFITPAHAWLIVSLILVSVEVFAASGVGFLFAGVAAFIVSMLVQANVIDAQNWPIQLGVFGALSAAIGLLLWRKLKHWKSSRGQKSQYANMIGDMATVGKGGLKKGEIGQVSWSGTTMMAQLDPSEPSKNIDEGAMVSITAVKGNQLFVALKAG